MSKKSYKKQKGFTLVETLIAILVLSMAIAAGFTAISSGLRAAYLAKNQVIAFYLAQDAFEYIRNVRDTIKLNSFDNAYNNPLGGWNDFQGSGGALDTCIGVNNKCKIDTSDSFVINPVGTITSTGIKTCTDSCTLLYDTSTGKYGYANTSTSVQSPFSRSVKVERLNGSEVEVSVTISWVELIIPKSFTVKSILLDTQ